MKKTKIKKVSFQGWENCVELNSGDFKLIVTTDVGPRVIGGFLGNSENIFQVDPKLAGKNGGEEWVNYGGHRLWHSPETLERTYMPDNDKIVARELEDGGVGFYSPTENASGITKSIHIYPLGDNRFRVEHFLRNDGVWDIEVAGWGISVMAPGGVAVIPQSNEHDKKGLLPTKFLSVWPYTDMNDSRITWGKDFILIHQDAKAKNPCKIGTNCEAGWTSYLNDGVAFTKHFDHFLDGEYPDNGCSVEVYTCAAMLELETLSPLYVLAPGDELLHVEEWDASPIDAEDEELMDSKSEKKPISAKKTPAKPVSKKGKTATEKAVSKK